MQSWSPTFKKALANTNFIAANLQSTSFGFPRDVTSHTLHFFVVNMHTASNNITKKVVTLLTRLFGNLEKRDILKTGEWNVGVFALCFGEVDYMDGVLAAGHPHACEKVVVNVERQAHLRQVVSHNGDTKKSSRKGSIYQHIYLSLPEVDCKKQGYVLIMQRLGDSL